MKLSDTIIKEFRTLPGGYNPIIHDPVIERLIKVLSPLIQKRAPKFKDEADLSEHVRTKVMGYIRELSLNNLHMNVEGAATAMSVGVALALIQVGEALYGKDGYKNAKMILDVVNDKVLLGGVNGLEHNGSDSERRAPRHQREP